MSNLQNAIRKTAWVSLVFVYLVITAGAIVRMTGSGMGCPDWPKCFGYAIPPTSEEEVTWQANRWFERGQMIVHEWEDDQGVHDRLLKAREDFQSATTFDPNQWEVYEKHDYSIFNPMHTWIEFINRLIGAFTGLPVLLLFVLTLMNGFREKRWLHFVLASGVLFMLGFEAWLGKLVVDGNLIPGSITIHMFGSMVLVFLLLVMIRRSSIRKAGVAPNVYWLMIAALVATLLQILLGTQVREEVDALIKGTAIPREAWVENLPGIFAYHRSFSWAVLLLNAAWIWLVMRANVKIPEMRWVVFFLLIQLIVGIVLAYFGMPAALQPIHIVGGVMMFGVLWSAVLRVGSRRSDHS